MGVDEGRVFGEVEFLSRMVEDEKVGVGYDLDVGLEGKEVFDFCENGGEGLVRLDGRQDRNADEAIHVGVSNSNIEDNNILLGEYENKYMNFLLNRMEKILFEVREAFSL